MTQSAPTGNKVKHSEVIASRMSSALVPGRSGFEMYAGTQIAGVDAGNEEYGVFGAY